MLEKCHRLDEAVAALFDTNYHATTKREMVTWAYCYAGTEHAVAQRILVEQALTGTALALVRLQYEATVRAAWIHHGADDSWIEKFTAPVSPGAVDEPQKGPPIDAMLQTLAKHLPAQNMEQLQNLHGAIKVMHSFVHGGVHTVAHAVRGYPAENVVSVLWNRNLLLWFSCQVLSLSTKDPRIQKEVRQAFVDIG